MRTEAPLLAPIFRSDGQARLLAELLLTGDELSLTDLAARIGLAYATVHREAERLLDAGILRERQVGRSRLMSANPDSPIVDPLRQILLVSTGRRSCSPRRYGRSRASPQRSSTARSPRA